MKQLESNAFGVKALALMMSAPERYRLFGQLNSGMMGPQFTW
jgi:hypothetical protein